MTKIISAPDGERIYEITVVQKGDNNENQYYDIDVKIDLITYSCVLGNLIRDNNRLDSSTLELVIATIAGINDIRSMWWEDEEIRDNMTCHEYVEKTVDICKVFLDKFGLNLKYGEK